MCNYYSTRIKLKEKAAIIQKGKGKNKGFCSDAMLVLGIV